MLLRRASVDDLSYILGLERTFCELGFVGSDDPATHRRQMSDPDCAYSIVETDGLPGGYVILRGLRSPNRSVELKRIVVAKPDHGLGRLVLKALLDTVFTDLSAHRFWLDVYDDNEPARHLYRSLGFREEGTLRECIKTGERYRSLMVMSILESEYRNQRSA